MLGAATPVTEVDTMRSTSAAVTPARCNAVVTAAPPRSVPAAIHASFAAPKPSSAA
jgi:hypothetical protein